MCGIAAFIGNDQNKIHESLVNFLILSQDSRGRDNCGIFYKAETEEGLKYCIEWGFKGDSAGNTNKFDGFMDKRKHKMLDFGTPYEIIAHSRKGSSGSTSMDNAHPFKVDHIVGVHNGTLYEWKKFMKELEVNIEGIDCDSEAIFKAIAEGKTEEFLKEYTGAASLVWKNLKDGKIYVWCGADPGYKYPNRPLHYVETNHGIYISSEDTPIENMIKMSPKSEMDFKDKDLDVYNFNLNCITVIENGKIVECQKINRTGTSTRPTYTNTNYSGYGGSNAKKSTKIGKNTTEKKEDNSNLLMGFQSFYYLPKNTVTPIRGIYCNSSGIMKSAFSSSAPLDTTQALKVDLHNKYGVYPYMIYYLSPDGALGFYSSADKRTALMTSSNSSIKRKYFEDFVCENGIKDLYPMYFYMGIPFKSLSKLLSLKERVDSRGNDRIRTSKQVCKYTDLPVSTNMIDKILRSDVLSSFQGIKQLSNLYYIKDSVSKLREKFYYYYPYSNIEAVFELVTKGDSGISVYRMVSNEIMSNANDLYAESLAVEDCVKEVKPVQVSAKALRYTCPSCNTDQLAPKEDADTLVSCNHCSEDLKLA